MSRRLYGWRRRPNAPVVRERRIYGQYGRTGLCLASEGTDTHRGHRAEHRHHPDERRRGLAGDSGRSTDALDRVIERAAARLARCAGFQARMRQTITAGVEMGRIGTGPEAP